MGIKYCSLKISPPYKVPLKKSCGIRRKKLNQGKPFKVNNLEGDDNS